jgi:lipopolysaccharide export system protein LptA
MFAPPPTPPTSRNPFAVNRPVRIQSDSMTREGTVTHYRGDVQMVTDTMLLRADELDFDSNGQKADVRGNVSFQLLPVSPKIVPLGGDSKPY